MKLNVVIFLVSALIALVNSQGERCYSPFNRIGQCVPFQQCYSLLRLFEVDKSRNSVNFLKQSQRNCGMRSYRGDPMVCCTDNAASLRRDDPTIIVIVEEDDNGPSYKPEPQRPTYNSYENYPEATTSTPFVLQPRTTTVNPGFQISESDSNPGFQISTESNPGFQISSESNPGFQISTESNPGFQISTESNPGFQISSESNPGFQISTPSNSVDDRFVFPDTEPKGREDANECKGPDGAFGYCTPLKQCRYLLNQYASRRGDQELIRFIRASNAICNYEDTVVCCPDSTKSQPAPPTKAPSTVPRLLTPQEGCGASNATHNRVVGGVDAQLGAWPWIALLGYRDTFGEISFKCGGSLVTKKHVMTAAHCIRNDLAVVRLGEHDTRTQLETKSIDIPIKRKEIHPNYDKRDGNSDIAMLLLENDVTFTELIHPVCIATDGPLLTKSYVRLNPFVAGWGRTEEGGKSADILQEVQLPVLSNDVCKDRYQKLRRLISQKQFNDAVICVGDLAGGHDSCQGDSGGPLMSPHNVNGDDVWYQIGIVSYGVGCARADVPGVYASVQKFSPWIQQMISVMT